MSARTRLNVDGRLRVKTSTKRRCRFWKGGWDGKTLMEGRDIVTLVVRSD